MATALTSEPVQQQTQVTAEEIFARISVREQKLSRLLVFYISGGLLFMLLPGTFLGVWNLVSISGRRAAESISPAWIQAHGHALMLGRIGSFILGIGSYSDSETTWRIEALRALVRMAHGCDMDDRGSAALVGERRSLAMARTVARFCGI